MNNLKSFILKFLEIIGYEGNKEEFIDNLTSVIYLDSLEALLGALPSDKQEVVKQQLGSAKSTEELMGVAKSNFDPNSFKDTVVSTTQKVFNEYLDEIDDVLTDEQKTKLEEFFQSIITPS